SVAVRPARSVGQLRQHEASEDAVFTIGPYTFRPSSKVLLNPKGNKVRLTEKETAVLRYLYRAGQRPVSRETLLQEVWGYNSGLTTHTLETHIYRLRQKIEKDAASPAILVTEAGGYTLVPYRRRLGPPILFCEPLVAFLNIAAEPLAMCYPALAGDTLRGRPTPRFRTIQGYPKDLASALRQAERAVN